MIRFLLKVAVWGGYTPFSDTEMESSRENGNQKSRLYTLRHCIKTRVLSFPKSCYRFCLLSNLIVFSGGGLSVLEMGVFQLSVSVKAFLVKSQQMSCFPFMFLSFCFHVPFIWISHCIHLCPFMFRSFCIMFLSCYFHFPFMFFPLGIHVLSFSVAM